MANPSAEELKKLHSSPPKVSGPFAEPVRSKVSPSHVTVKFEKSVIENGPVGIYVKPPEVGAGVPVVFANPIKYVAARAGKATAMIRPRKPIALARAYFVVFMATPGRDVPHWA